MHVEWYHAWEEFSNKTLMQCFAILLKLSKQTHAGRLKTQW